MLFFFFSHFLVKNYQLNLNHFFCVALFVLFTIQIFEGEIYFSFISFNENIHTI